MAANYDLHEFDPTKIITKEIDPEKVESAKFLPYDKNSKGSTIIDRNKEIVGNRTLISLQTTKSSQAKFNQIISIDFEEFTEPINDSTLFLQAKIQALETAKSKLLASNANKTTQILEMEREIESFKEIISSSDLTPMLLNNVPDTLFADKTLYADRTGEEGAPFYPVIQNKLMSKNRKSIGIIQNDGNFVIKTGEFDEDGYAIGDSDPVNKAAFGWNQLNNSVPALHLFSGANGQLEVVRINPWQVAWGSGRQSLSKAARVVLDDNGILTLYDGEIPKWSSFGM